MVCCAAGRTHKSGNGTGQILAKKQSLGTHEGVIVGENSFHAVNTRVMEGPLEVEQFSYHSTHTPTEHSSKHTFYPIAT